MAITTLDGLIAGMQPPQELFKGPTPTLTAGIPMSLFQLPGIPGAAVDSTSGVAGEALTSYPGQIPFTNPDTGKNAYLARLSATATVPGQLWLCDLLWHNSGLSAASSTEQTVGSVAWPARDVDGSSNGRGVMIAVAVGGATVAYKPTVTLTYTNAAGVTGRTATNIIPTIASSPAGAFYPIGLQAGDTGVRSVQSYKTTLYWGASATVALVAYRVLARLDLPLAGAGNCIDAVTSGLPKLHPNTVPFLVFIPASTTASTVQGHLVMSHG